MTEESEANFFTRLSACAFGDVGAPYLPHDVSSIINLGLMYYETKHVFFLVENWYTTSNYLNDFTRNVKILKPMKKFCSKFDTIILKNIFFLMEISSLYFLNVVKNNTSSLFGLNWVRPNQFITDTDYIRKNKHFCVP